MKSKSALAAIASTFALWFTAPTFAACDKPAKNGENEIIEKIVISKKLCEGQEPEMAAKLTWEHGKQEWRREIILYNNAKMPPATHEIFTYVKGLQEPAEPGRKPWENRFHKIFPAVK